MPRSDLLNHPRLAESKEKKRKALLHKSLAWLGIFTALFVGLGLVSRLNKINIQNIEVLGNKVAETEALTATAWDSVSGNYLLLYPKKNLLFYPKGNIEENLRKEFKILKDINISIKEDRTLSVALSEREPAFIWCGEELPIIPEGDECYFMDNTGFIFSKAPFFSGDVYFRFYGKRTSEEIAGSSFLPEIFQNLDSFVASLKDMGLEPLLLEEKGERLQIYLVSELTLPEAPRIIIKKDFDLESVAGNLRSVLGTEPLESDFKNKYKDLQYIDLSFGNKVYYKFR